MAKIAIQRTSEYTNRFRSFGIYIDGEKVDIIKDGQTKEFDISSGHHTLYCKIDWCSSPVIAFEAEEGASKRFKVGGFKNANWLVGFALTIIVLNIFFRRTMGSGYIFFLIPAFLILVYFLTIGRRKYLTLSML